VKKETKILIFLTLLLANTTRVIAQSEVSDKDLQKLLEEEAATSNEVSEVSETPSSPEPSEESPSKSTSAETNDSEPVSETPSSETVDLNSLESSENEPVSETVEASDEASSESKVEEAPSDVVFGDKEEGKFVPSKPGDDLESIKADIGQEGAPTETAKKDEATQTPTVVTEKKSEEPAVFDVGREERELLSLAQNIQGQITDPEWNEVATATKVDTYTVVKDDWLFKISKRIFGSGYYYPKIWSLNSFITNPHFIEPGMVLSFTTGSSSQAPEVKLGAFTQDELGAAPGSIGNSNPSDLSNFGEGSRPEWLDEKKKLENQGIYFQYASEETMDDLMQAGEQALNREYESYEPPKTDFDVILPNQYDSLGFDKDSRILYSFKEGFYLSTFLSTNIVQDFGSITNGPDENIFFTKLDTAYVEFDDTLNILPGDKYSVYSSGGKVKHENSDREGYKYSIVGHIKVIKKIRNKWEVEFIEVSGTPQRGDRVTAYTPKIERITRTYNSRLIEAGILAGYEPGKRLLSFGDVLYLDRGRADGVEMGNVFEVYGFKDRALAKNITDQPTYKIGEVTVITLTDNFATALVSKSIKDFYVGEIALTKTKESYLREQNARMAKPSEQKEMVGGKALEELDVELNLENLNDDLLKQADKIQLTEDELAELERQEREKSVIRESEKDLKALERLENEIEQAETILNDAKLDEDKLLEQQNLNDIEKKNQGIDQDSLDEIEENLGKRYIDEDINSKDNPFGLTEFDVEEIDELLNTEKKE
jgi:nucleoid-associated protein YgaU